MRDMKTYTTWLDNNKLIVNWSKTHAIYLKNDNSMHHPDITEGHTKKLGVMIDKKFNFNAHTNYLIGKVNSKLNILSRNASLFSIRLRLTIFKIFIIPHFEYCSILFYNSQKNENKNNFNKQSQYESFV